MLLLQSGTVQQCPLIANTVFLHLLRRSNSPLFCFHRPRTWLLWSACRSDWTLPCSASATYSLNAWWAFERSDLSLYLGYLQVILQPVRQPSLLLPKSRWRLATGYVKTVMKGYRSLEICRFNVQILHSDMFVWSPVDATSATSHWSRWHKEAGQGKTTSGFIQDSGESRQPEWVGEIKVNHGSRNRLASANNRTLSAFWSCQLLAEISKPELNFFPLRCLAVQPSLRSDTCGVFVEQSRNGW